MIQKNFFVIFVISCLLSYTFSGHYVILQESDKESQMLIYVVVYQHFLQRIVNTKKTVCVNFP